LKSEILENEKLKELLTMFNLSLTKGFFSLWYKEEVSPHLSREEKQRLAHKISRVTLQTPIWFEVDSKTKKPWNFIDKFPELKPFSSTGEISGIQLVAVLEGIVKEVSKL